MKDIEYDIIGVQKGIDELTHKDVIWDGTYDFGQKGADETI